MGEQPRFCKSTTFVIVALHRVLIAAAAELLVELELRAIAAAAEFADVDQGEDIELGDQRRAIATAAELAGAGGHRGGPRARAAESPAIVRSRIRSRSNNRRAR